MDEHRVEVPSRSSEQNETPGASQPDNQPDTDTRIMARVPEHVSNENSKAYVPQVVSIGPFHYSNGRLVKHENLKRQHLVPEARVVSFEKLVDDIICQKIKLVHRWYCAEGECLHKDEKELGRMMARDGLFLLRFLKEMHSTERRSDKLFEPKPQIQQDIMKLENQIPSSVFQMVVEWEAGTVKDFSSTLKRFFITLCPFPNIEVRVYPNSHLLGFMYDNIINSSDHSTYHSEHNRLRKMTSIINLLKALKVGENQRSKNKRDNSLLSAAELEDKGVNFTAIKSQRALKDIRFDDITCKFYLPIIQMDSTTDVVMRNLLAFELYVCKGGTKPVRCYIDLMERLIDKVEDVKVLRDAGIIRNHLSDDKVVANVWNAMRDVLDQEKGEYEPIGTVINGVKDFYNNKYITMYAEFKKKYFSRPWLLVALVGGIIQLFLSLLQTIIAWEQRK